MSLQLTSCHRQKFHAKSCFIMPEDCVKSAIISYHEPKIASQHQRWV